MTRLSHGEKLEEEPPWTMVDGRSDRARALDGVVRAWELAHPAPEVKRPSESSREDGLRLIHRFGIAVCMRRRGVRRRSGRFVPNSITRPCGYLIIVKNGGKLPTCKSCGKRVWVNYKDVVFQHDDFHIIKRVIQDFRAWRGRRPRAMVSVALFNGWARLVEEKMEMERFYAHLPWNLTNFGGSG